MNDPRSIAQRLAGTLPAAFTAALLADPSAAIEQHFGLTVRLTDAVKISGGCGIEGRYHPQLMLIEVSDELHPRRFKFTVLHELGHHMAQHDRATIPLVAKSGRLEESVAHAFAAELLIPTAMVDAAFSAGATAQAVVELLAASGASRWACCVRASQRVPGNGHVLVARDGVVEFAAPVGHAFPLGRGAVQADDHLINDAARNGTARRSPVRLRQPSGVVSEEFAGDAVAVDGHVFAVLTDANRPPWGGWVGALAQTKEWLEVDCEACDRTTWGFRLCPMCGDPICAEDDCGWCSCKKRPPKRERMCTECFQTRPIGQFDGDGTICVEHR